MLHECNTYCLGQENEKGRELRECRFGFGTESTPGSKVTPGQDLTPEPTIVKDKKGVEQFLLLGTKSRRIVQHSRVLLQTWRANTDIQLLIYRLNPNIPDVGEIEVVS